MIPRLETHFRPKPDFFGHGEKFYLSVKMELVLASGTPQCRLSRVLSNCSHSSLILEAALWERKTRTFKLLKQGIAALELLLLTGSTVRYFTFTSEDALFPAHTCQTQRPDSNLKHAGNLTRDVVELNTDAREVDNSQTCLKVDRTRSLAI